MPFNGTGNFTLSQPAFSPGTTISSASVNSDLSDIATNGLSKCVTVDGQNTITGQLKFPNGTAAAPSFTFASDLTTGMFYIGANHLGFSAGGTQIVGFNGGNLGTGQNGNVIEVNTSSGIAYPCPVGSVLDFAGPNAPSGWLFCYGQVFNVSSYPELYVSLGSTNTYGGNGTTPFGIPDCRGRLSAGKDNMGGSAANRITAAVGNFDGTVLGGVGGQQNKVIANGNLPANIPYSDTGHFHTQFGRSLSSAGKLVQIGGSTNAQEDNQNGDFN